MTRDERVSFVYVKRTLFVVIVDTLLGFAKCFIFIIKVYDIIFIDGCHEYHVATADLENCRKLANNQTIVILDDTVFTEEGLNYGATRAWLTQVNNGKIREEGRVLYEGTRGMAWGKYIF